MSYYVCKGAKLKCSMGSDQSDLEVVHLERPVKLCGQPMAGIMDHKPMMNIKPFGQCKSLANPTVASATAANYGRLQEMPCIPNTLSPWVNCKINFLVKGQPALLDCSKCMCLWAGVIEITDPGQKLMSCGSSGLGSQDMGAMVGAQNVAATPDNGLALQGAGIGLAAVAGSAVSLGTASQASQGMEAVAGAQAASTQKTLIREVTGPEKAFSRQKRKYEVAKYNVDKKDVTNENKANIKWAVKVAGERIIELADKKGKEKVDIEIFDTWAGKDILVMAYIGELKENVNQKTNIGPLSQGLLIRIVEGKDYALYGRKIEYKVTGYNKDNVNAGDKNRIKWAIKIEEGNQETFKDVNGKEVTGEEITVEINRERINEEITRITVIPYLKKPAETRGKEIVFEIREGHIGEKSAEIIVMPYLNTPTEIVSKKTFMGQNAFENLISKINLLNGMDLSSDTSNDLSINIGVSSGRRCLYQELTDNELSLLIEELMDVMQRHLVIGWAIETIEWAEKTIKWVEEAKGYLKEETLKIRLVNDRANNTGQEANSANQNKRISLVFLSPPTPSNNEFVIIFKVNNVGERSVRELQKFFIHEFRHFWQHKNGAWKGKLIQELNGFPYKDIRTETDAYTIQFEFERKLNIGIDVSEINLKKIFEDTEKNNHGSEKEDKLKTGFLRMNGYSKEAGYIDPYYDLLKN